MLPLAHGALGYLDELLPFFLIAGFAIILILVAFLSRKTENTLESARQRHQTRIIRYGG